MSPHSFLRIAALSVSSHVKTGYTAFLVLNKRKVQLTYISVGGKDRIGGLSGKNTYNDLRIKLRFF